MFKKINDHSKLILFISFILLVGLILSGCDSGGAGDNTYTLTINVEGEGTVKPAVGSHKYNENEIAFLEVSPDNNYEFKEWSGDNGDEIVYAAEDEKYSLLMDGNKEVTAHFVDIVTAEVSNSNELLESLEDSTIEKIILTSDIEKSEKDYQITKNIIIDGQGHNIKDDFVFGEGETIDIEIINLLIEGESIVDIGEGEINYHDSNLNEVDIKSVGSQSFNLSGDSTAKSIINNAAGARFVFSDSSSVEHVTFNASANVLRANQIENALVNNENVKMHGNPKNIDDNSLYEAAVLNILEIEDEGYYFSLKNNYDSSIEVFRDFVGTKEKIATISPGDTYQDQIPFYESSYDYLVYKNDNLIESNLVTSKEESRFDAFYEFEEHIEKHLNQEDIKMMNEELYEYKSKYYLHGVEIVLLVDEESYTELGHELTNKLFDYFLHKFHRSVIMYNGTVIDKNYAVIISGDNYVESKYPMNGFIQGLPDSSLLEDFLDKEKYEPTSHGVAHHWIAGPETIATHLGEGYDPKENVWIVEGFAYYNGVLALGEQATIDHLTSNDTRYMNNADMPLNEMGINLRETDENFAMYLKGGKFLYLVSEKLTEEGNTSYEEFLQYLYREFMRKGSAILLTPEKLKYLLEDFSGLNFDDLFDKYVYGTEIIEIESIDLEYLPQWDY